LNVNSGGVVLANLDELSRLLSEYALSPFLRSTGLLVALLSESGRLLAWNPAFDSIKQEIHDVNHLRDFLSLSSRTVFDLLLSTVTHDRITTQGELDLGQGNRLGGYTCFLYPVPDGRVLFVAEPSHAIADLESLSEELQRTKQSLERKETELQSVLARATDVSSIDALTSLPSRRQIMVQLQEAAAFSDQYGTLLAILLIDIDYFKRINDIHGHTVGDEVLRSLAGKLRQFVNPPEMIGRYGGEEFLIVLPHYTLNAAVEHANSLCEQIRALSMNVQSLTFSITVSVGIAQHKVRREDWQRFLYRADLALDRAKSDGRDRCMVSE
jgi:diguanylate cyclase (GGDEF)-like protein